MTDVTAAGEMPIEPVPPVPPGPEAIAALDAAPGRVAAPGVAAEIEPLHVVVPERHGDPASGDEVETEVVESFDPRISIPETLGPVRRAILEGLIDGEGPMSVSELHALMPVGTPRGTAEAAILREYRSGRILRTSPGHYALTPVKPPGAKPAAPPELDKSEDEWFAALDGWISDPASWNVEELGPRPNEPGRRIPADIVARGVDRSRKRQERRKDREVAQARQAAADRGLRDRLLAACNGNFQASPALDDMIVVREVLKTVPLDCLIMTIRQKVDKRCFPGNPPLATWCDPVFLRAVAESYCSGVVIPSLVDAWGAAGKTPAPTAQSSPAAAQMPDDIDELRGLHDDEHAPAGPHVMSPPGAAPPDMPLEPVEHAEPPAATQPAPEQENAPAVPPAQPDAIPDEEKVTIVISDSLIK
jgi:hypothetical protein